MGKTKEQAMEDAAEWLYHLSQEELEEYGMLIERESYGEDKGKV
jgi:hypothetical protein